MDRDRAEQLRQEIIERRRSVGRAPAPPSGPTVHNPMAMTPKAKFLAFAIVFAILIFYFF